MIDQPENNREGITEIEALRKRIGELERENARRDWFETQWQNTFDALPDLIALIDADHRVLRVNHAMARHLKCSPEETGGRFCYELVHGCSSPPDFCPHTKTMKSGMAEKAEVFEERLDGFFEVTTTPLYDVDGNLTGSVHIAREITKRKQTEEALLTSEEKFRHIFEKAYEGIMIIQGESFSYVNPAFVRIMGHSQKRLTSEPFVTFIHPDDRDMVLDRHRRRMRGEDVESVYDLRIVTADGTVKWITNHAQAIDWGGEPANLGFIVDITDRKKAEEVLRQSEEKHRLLFETMSQGVIYQDADGTIISANRAAENILDISFDQMQGKTSMDPRWKMISEDGCDVPGTEHPAMVALKTGQKVGPVVRGIFHPGKNSHVWLSITAIPLFLPGKAKPSQAYAIFEDITERRQAEEQLHLQSLVLDQISDRVTVTDLGGVITYVNEAEIQSLGYSREELMGASTKIFGDDPELGATQQKILEETLRLGHWRGEVINKGIDGNDLIMDCRTQAVLSRTGEAIALCGIATDITDRKHTEEALAHSYDLMRYIIEHSRSAVAVHDKNLHYVYVSQRYLDEYNITEQDVIGRHHYDVFPDLPQKWRDVHQRALAGEILSADDDHYEKSDGTIDWTRWECRPWYEADGSIGGIVIYTEVITDRKRVEDEKLELERRLAQAQKMESVGRLAGGIAHDFNNMLGVILGHSELALDNTGQDNSLHGHLEEIRKAAQRSADLTRQLLAFARRQAVAPRQLDLNDTVAGMLKMLRRLIGESITLTFKPGSDLWPVRIDPAQVDQILANLCVNARDAIDEVGAVMIETSNITIDDTYLSHQEDMIPGEYLMLAVSDNGCGMDRDVQDKLFEPFFTTKPMGEGTGLGLATVYGIVKQNEGFINVYSEPGQGTTFKIYLPRHDAPAHEAPEKDRPSKAPGGTETILVVEDEPSILNMTVTMLERLGYRVLAADRPGRAMQMAKEQPGEIDLLITDVVMPEMNGRDLSEKLLFHHPAIKCLFMSGYTADVIARHGVLDEGVQYIQKPFSKRALAEKVREALEST